MPQSAYRSWTCLQQGSPSPRTRTLEPNNQDPETFLEVDHGHNQELPKRALAQVLKNSGLYFQIHRFCFEFQNRVNSHAPELLAKQYSKPQIFQAPCSLIIIDSGPMFLCNIFALECKKVSPSDNCKRPYLISTSYILNPWKRKNIYRHSSAHM